ncbi:hypothetical protein [Ectopseudomonas composti]|nr:hypothetical protein [Pseudomonas composti]
MEIDKSKGVNMEITASDVEFKEGRRVLFMGGGIGLLLMGLSFQAFRMGASPIAGLLLLVAVWLLASAWINRGAGSKPLMILKDEGIWFFNANGLLPYTSIGDMEIETYCTHKDFQFNSTFHIPLEKVDTLPAFQYSRLDGLFLRPGAARGRGFRKHVVVFRYGNLRDADGKGLDADDLFEELSYRINRACQAEAAILVPTSAANDALSSVQ